MKRELLIALLGLALFACNSCGDDDDNQSDGGDTDTDTDSDSDTVSDCSDVDLGSLPFSKLPAVKCFCPGDGEQNIGITEEEILAKFPGDDVTIANLMKLVGTKMVITEGSFDKCVVATIGRANFPAGTLGSDADGAAVDNGNPDNKVLSAGGLEYRVTSTSDPNGQELEPAKEITLEFPSWYGTVMKWMEDQSVPHFDKVAPTYIDSTGAKYVTPTLSAYAVANRPFDSFEVAFVPGDVNGYDVDTDGVLIEITLSDEEQTAFPKWVEFKVTENTETYTLVPTTEDNRYRVPIFDGQHDINFNVADNNTEVAYRHNADQAKSVDLTVDLCEDVVCEDDGDLCNGSEACDPSDGECKSYDPLVCDDGLACNGTETCIPATGCTNPADVECGSYGDCTEPAGTCSCDEGYDPATNCTSCIAGYTGYPTCVSELCYGVSCPDDEDLCNGDEVCDPGTGNCIHQNPLVCDDTFACNGLETCIPATGCTNPSDIDCGSYGDCVEPAGTCSCDTGYNSSTNCTSCSTGYSGYPACTDTNGCAGNPCFTGVTCHDVPAPGTGHTCDPCPTGYTGDGEICACDTANGYFDDGLGGCANPCDADPCGLAEHGDTCTPSSATDYTCTCDLGWDPDIDCTTCALGYEGTDCHQDVTPPADPMITTCDGFGSPTTCPDPPGGWDPSQADITISGTCNGPDTAMIQYRFKKGSDAWIDWTDISSYTAGSSDWSWSGTVESGVDYIFEFRALDFVPGGNPSGADQVLVTSYY
jgi:hypothetical protein